MNNDGAKRADWIIALAKDEQCRADSVLGPDSIWPTPIAKCYGDLFDLMEEGEVYGSLIQIKDLYETIIKVPVLAALIYLCGTKKDAVLADADLLKKWISNTLSFGNWDALASALLNRNKREEYLPANLADCIDKARKLVSMKISEGYPNAVKWRNDVIGHGALQFKDSKDYQNAFPVMLGNLKKYFEGQGRSFRGCDSHYKQIVFASNDTILQGKDAEFTSDQADLRLVINGESVEAGAFSQMNTFLFSSFYYKKRTIKYLDYESGKDLIKSDLELSEYVSAYQDIAKYQDNSFSAEIVSREEDEILSCLSQPQKYIPPYKVIDEIIDFMDKDGRGVIMLCMERGTGKSAFANAVNTLYHDPGTALIEDTIIRSYSLRNAELRSINDFINVINIVFERSFDPKQDIRYSNEQKKEISISDEDPASSLADELNSYQEAYAEKYGVYNLMLVLDGIDEVTDRTRRILDYIPSSGLLNEGVFIICTSRFEDEETVPCSAREYIRAIYKKSNRIIEVRRKEEENRCVLEEYIRQEDRDISDEAMEDLIKRSDYRMLYLKAYLALYRSGISYDIGGNIASGYIRKLIRQYNRRHAEQFRKTAAMICLLGPIAIRDYFDRISGDVLTLGFIGGLNDFLPLLTVTDSDRGREYMLANETYYAALAPELHDEFPSLIETVKDAFIKSNFPKESEGAASDRNSAVPYEKAADHKAYISAVIEQKLKEDIFWILTIKKSFDFAMKFGFEEVFLTENFVNYYFMFSDMFTTNNSQRIGYVNIVAEAALQTAMNMLLTLSQRNRPGLHFWSNIAWGTFTRKLYGVEGYDNLLKTVFKKNADRGILAEWKNIFFSMDILSIGEIAEYYEDDRNLIEQILESGLADTVSDLLAPGSEGTYLSYLLYFASLDLDHDLMEKVMNRIVHSYLYDDFSSNGGEAKNWLKKIKQKHYEILYPEDEKGKEKIRHCLKYDEKDISERMSDLFWIFRVVNADLSGVDLREIKDVLTNEDPVVKNAAVKELKKCLEAVDHIFESGILPDQKGGFDPINLLFHKDSDMTEKEGFGEQYTVLNNCSPLFEYADLVYKDKTSKVLERWEGKLCICLKKHNDLWTYLELIITVESLYEALYKFSEHDKAKKRHYLSKYVDTYNNWGYLVHFHIMNSAPISSRVILPSKSAINLMISYYNVGMLKEAKKICRRIADGISEFRKKIIENGSDIHWPILSYHYLMVCKYVCVSREMGYSDLTENIHIDFKQELSEIDKILGTCNKYTDLSDLDNMVESILFFYNNTEAGDIADSNVCREIKRMIEAKINSVDKETAKELRNIADRICQ